MPLLHKFDSLCEPGQVIWLLSNIRSVNFRVFKICLESHLGAFGKGGTWRVFVTVDWLNEYKSFIISLQIPYFLYSEAHPPWITAHLCNHCKTREMGYGRRWSQTDPPVFNCHQVETFPIICVHSCTFILSALNMHLKRKHSFWGASLQIFKEIHSLLFLVSQRETWILLI